MRGTVTCVHVAFLDLSHYLFLVFFFSSRRRHTRSLCDWSSDVCSSDLGHSARNGGIAGVCTWANQIGNTHRFSKELLFWQPCSLPRRLARWQAQSHRRRVSDRKSTRLNSSHTVNSYAVFCL